MPHYMDIHSIAGATFEDVVGAHNLDMKYAHQHNVVPIKYWFNADAGKVFCLFEAPSAEATQCLHEKAHGLIAEKVIEVDPDLIGSFMGEAVVNDGGGVIEPGADAKLDSAIRTILFTDIVDSTAMTSLHGDDAAIAMLEVHDRAVREALADNNGREVKHTGDGIMASFISSACAVRAACQLIEKLSAHNRTDPPYPVVVRVGISAGEPVEQANDLFGSSVQLAARLCAQAEPSQVLVSNVVADLCVGKGLRFVDAGPATLKGFESPIPTRAVEMVC